MTQTVTPTFEFGANWRRFLDNVDDAAFAGARRDLAAMLGFEELTGRTALDVGSGSGLMSAALRSMGAQVTSFDVDEESVACTYRVRVLLSESDETWRVTTGSALDEPFMDGLGTFDLVYSWGVLHHTGNQWKAIELTAGRVAPGGYLLIALYNDQGLASRYWSAVKQRYSVGGKPTRTVLVAASGAWFRAKDLAADSMYVAAHRSLPKVQARPRGMNRKRDLVDWVGGWPFEFSRPEEVLAALRPLGFTLERMKTCRGGHGCNEYLLRRENAS